jgi:hypothetical protein
MRNSLQANAGLEASNGLSFVSHQLQGSFLGKRVQAAFVQVSASASEAVEKSQAPPHVSDVFFSQAIKTLKGCWPAWPIVTNRRGSRHEFT